MRRKKPFSCRPKKLTEQQEADLLDWYGKHMSIRKKAAQLGISVRALYDYVRGTHKPRKESLESVMRELTSTRVEVPQISESECRP